MSTNRDFDRIAAAWLAEGPSQLADRVLDDAFAEVHLTHQRRGPFAPWRYLTMNRSARLVLAAATSLAVLGAVAIGLVTLGPRLDEIGGASPTRSPIPPRDLAATPLASRPAWLVLPPLDTPTWSAFSSTRYGYDIRYPTGWRVGPGTAPVTFDQLTSRDFEFLLGGDGRFSGLHTEGVYDVFQGGGGGDKFYPILGAASTRLPDGMSEDRWLAAYDRGTYIDDTCVPRRDDWEPVTVDGVASGVYTGCGFVESISFVSGRAYTFTVTNGMNGVRQGDHELLRAFLSTVKFRPELADDSQ